MEKRPFSLAAEVLYCTYFILRLKSTVSVFRRTEALVIFQLLKHLNLSASPLPSCASAAAAQKKKQKGSHFGDILDSSGSGLGSQTWTIQAKASRLLIGAIMLQRCLICFVHVYRGTPEGDKRSSSCRPEAGFPRS